MIIELMRKEDLPELLVVQKQCYTTIVPESKASFLAKLEASPSTCFVARDDNKLIGYLISLPWTFATPPKLNMLTAHTTSTPDCLYLHDLAVSPTIRQSGVGKTLIQHFLKQFHHLHFKRASLIAIQKSAAYWSQHGFKTVEGNTIPKSQLRSYGDDATYMTLVKE